MKSLISLLSLLFTYTTAQATSMHPCTPVVQARPIIISCSENGLYYGIKIHTKMSDSRRCPADQIVEVQTATVSIGDFDGNIQKKLTIGSGQFIFTLSSLGDATFKSESESLDLNNCASPLYGGFSVGN